MQEIKRLRILKAGMTLLASKGFHGFSIKEVADNAQVATGTVYVYFRDKQDMISQLHMDILHRVAAAAFVGWDEVAPSFGRYRCLCMNLWQYSLTHSETIMCKRQFEMLPPDILRLQRVEMQRLFEPLYILFNEAKEEGELLLLPNEVLFSVTVGTISQVAYQQILGMVNIHGTVLDKIIEASWRGVSQSSMFIHKLFPAADDSLQRR